jgi:hypothetical protein
MATRARLQPILERLLEESCAEGCVVLRTGGAVIAGAGRLPSFRPVPHDWRLQIEPLNEHASLLVSFAEGASLGLVRLRMKKATDQLRTALRGVETPAILPD